MRGAWVLAAAKGEIKGVGATPALSPGTMTEGMLGLQVLSVWLLADDAALTTAPRLDRRSVSSCSLKLFRPVASTCNNNTYRLCCQPGQGPGCRVSSCSLKLFCLIATACKNKAEYHHAAWTLPANCFDLQEQSRVSLSSLRLFCPIFLLCETESYSSNSRQDTTVVLDLVRQWPEDKCA